MVPEEIRRHPGWPWLGPRATPGPDVWVSGRGGVPRAAVTTAYRVEPPSPATVGSSLEMGGGVRHAVEAGGQYGADDGDPERGPRRWPGRGLMRRIRRRCARRPAVRRPLDDAVPHATRPQHATQAAASSTVPPGPREAGCVGWCGRRRRSAARLRAVISQPTPATAALVAAPVARRPSPVNRAPLRPWRPSRAPAGMRRQAKTMTEASTVHSRSLGAGCSW